MKKVFFEIIFLCFLPWLHAVSSYCRCSCNAFSEMWINWWAWHWFKSFQLTWCSNLIMKKKMFLSPNLTTTLTWSNQHIRNRKHENYLRRIVVQNSKELQLAQLRQGKLALRSRWQLSLPLPSFHQFFISSGREK
jgi:hypothetical protein